MQRINRVCLIAVFTLMLMLATAAFATVKPHGLFTDNAVLQQGRKAPVWGTADDGEKVTVKFCGQEVSTVAKDGKWMVWLKPLKAGGPFTMAICGKNCVELKNVLVGEVWICSGQSNMQMTVKSSADSEKVIAQCKDPMVRLITIPRGGKDEPQTELPAANPPVSWQECAPETLPDFSAVGYFFGKHLREALKVPVGLISSNVGGTPAEAWTRRAVLEKEFPEVFTRQTEAIQNFPQTLERYNKAIADLKKAGKPIPQQMKRVPENPVTSAKRPCGLYNAMIAPIAGFAMRGALWYQGESNLMGTNANNDYREYADKMAALVGGWRQIWGEGDFAFYFVQIAPFKYCGGKSQRVNSPEMLPEFWTLQSRAARRLKHTGMVVTTDLVDNLDDIHPRDKATVGHRLAGLALDKTYEQEVSSESPAFNALKVVGNKAVLTFEHTHGGLVSKDGQPLTWFEVAGAAGKFVPAVAKIVGKKVEVSAAGVAQPVAVRFAWHQLAQPNLFNQAGLPAEPFNTQLPVE